MTVKQFLQSKIFKCIIVLLCIALVSGGLLAILNDLLYVDEAMLIERGIKEVCGDGVSGEKVDIAKDYQASGDGVVLQVLKLKGTGYDGDYLIKAQGKHGFQEGTVSTYVLFHNDNGTYKVTKVSVAEYASSQTLMSKITDKNLAIFGEKDSVSPKEVASGATYSSTAIVNSVNEAKAYVKTYIMEG